MKRLSWLFFLFFVFTDVIGQSNNLKALGDKEFKSANYFKAASYYKMAVDKANQPVSIPFYSNGKKSTRGAEIVYLNYQLAESYRLNHQYEKGAGIYLKIINDHGDSTYTLAKLHYGQCLRAEGRFDEAIAQLQQFKTTRSGDKETIAIADREIASCIYGKQQLLLRQPVNITKMSGAWNAEAGDYAFSQNGNNYWFTSSRLSDHYKIHSNRIYFVSDKNISTPIPITFGKDSIANMEYGAPSIAPTGNKMYLTGWYKQGSKTILNIYSSELKNNKWSDLNKLNNYVNVDGFNALQPFVTGDGKCLFFASDRPGGEGGFDIWRSDLDSLGNPTNAINLGKTVNTPDDEEAPFYESKDRRLVFSSKGFTGLGGFDFFESYEDNGNWSVPSNLGYPINSPKDDLYYYGDPDDEKKFYLSSDRESDCCLNLFEGHYSPILISGKITDCDSNKLLTDVNVTLLDSLTGKTLKQGTVGSNGTYSFRLLKNIPLKLAVEKAGYFKKNIPIETKISLDTISVPEICLQVLKVDKPIVIKNIFYDFNSAALRSESKAALNNLVAMMHDNPTVKIEISAHTDSIGSDAYNLKLSGARAKSCVDYIIAKGINSDRIVAKGYGKSLPVAPNSLPDGKDNPEGRQLNRRAEFTVKK